jgi:hypothetical protein
MHQCHPRRAAAAAACILCRHRKVAAAALEAARVHGQVLGAGKTPDLKECTETDTTTDSSSSRAAPGVPRVGVAAAVRTEQQQQRQGVLQGLGVRQGVLKCRLLLR